MEFINKKPLIYVISGKAGSGKDTVSKIIKEYYKDKKSKKLSYAYYLKQYVKKIFDWDGNEETKPRQLLQSIGIDLIKNKIDSNLLIRRVLEDIEVYSYFYDVIIITDARLIEEVEFPKQKYSNVISIRINNDGDNNLSLNEKNHITEVNLDNYNKFDYIISNNGDYEDLKKEIVRILEVENHE